MKKSHSKKNILFIDFGDIHISYFVVSFIDNSYEILYREDLNEVGGLFINLKIMEYIKSKFCKGNNIENINFKSQMKILKECDKIMVLFNGEILQIGTHDELINDTNGYYHQIDLKQNKKNH